MNRIGIMFCLVLALGRSSCLASGPAFQFSREIDSPFLSSEELLAVTLDTNMFAATEPDLSDMRLIDEQGSVVPYLLRKVQATRASTSQKTWTASHPNVRLLEDGGLEITLELKEDDPQPKGLTLVSPLKNYEKQVRVYSSPTGNQWELSGEESVIFDYSRFMDVRRDSIRIRATSNRHFRILIDSVTAEQELELLSLTRRLRGTDETEREEKVTIKRRPFRIDRIDFWGQVEQKHSAGDKKNAYSVRGYRVEQAPQNRQTRILVDTGREPLTSFELLTSSRNFSRRVIVEVEDKRGVQSSWRKIGESTFSRIDFKGLKQEKLVINFSESRRENYRLVIDNRDSPPLEVEGINASGTVYELLLLASPNREYQLVYGSADAETPQYDTAAIQEVLDQGFRPTLAELGARDAGLGVMDLVTDSATSYRWSNLLKNRVLLFGTISLLVIVLTWVLYHAVKRLDNLPSE